MLSDCLLIITIAVFTALAGEGLTWLLVYRSEQYQRLKVGSGSPAGFRFQLLEGLLVCGVGVRRSVISRRGLMLLINRFFGCFIPRNSTVQSEMERKTKKLERKKEAAADVSDSKNAKRRIDREEERLKVGDSELW